MTTKVKCEQQVWIHKIQKKRVENNIKIAITAEINKIIKKNEKQMPDQIGALIKVKNNSIRKIIKSKNFTNSNIEDIVNNEIIYTLYSTICELKKRLKNKNKQKESNKKHTKNTQT